MLHIMITKRDLPNLTGLQFVSEVVQLGRPFPRRLYALQGIGSHPNHYIRLNLPAEAHIMWWLVVWSNGIVSPYFRTLFV